MHKTRVLVVGDSMIDRHWYCKPKAVSPEAPILTWDVDRIEDKPGGAANVAYNLYALENIYNTGIQTTFLSAGNQQLLDCIGDEFFSEIFYFGINNKISIKNRVIFENPHQQIVRFDEDSDRTIDRYTIENIATFIAPRKYDIGLISDYGHGLVSRGLVELVHNSCDLVICDPKGTDTLKYTGLVDILTPNRKELKDLTSDITVDSWMAQMMNLASTIKGHRGYSASVILKCGEEGCICYNTSTGFKNFTPYRTDQTVIDPMGAGDTFVATLTFELAKNKPIHEAIYKANQLAGISVTYPNCWVPTEEECLKEQSE